MKQDRMVRGPRAETDQIGHKTIPGDAYYGVQTLRAIENFRVSGVTIGAFPGLVCSLCMVKQAAARANCRLGLLSEEKCYAISQACEEIIDGALRDQFVVDAIQGGAGTSTNMNANEVIANRALEILGHERGDYRHMHPNNDVNLSQSTNDVYPTSLRLSVLLGYGALSSSMDALCYQLKLKSVEFSTIVKIGRTQLQDAVPITLGQEFGAFHATLKKDIKTLEAVVGAFREVNLGATAVGTGINTDPEYASLAIEELCQVSGERLMPSRNLIEATSDLGDFVSLSGVLKRHAIKLSKISNDLRLMSSGPRAGLYEINLPAVQPGSSIMPGKVNPVIPELVNQVAFQVVGNDLVVSMAAEAGQLQLNVMEPIVIFNILQSIDLLANAIDALADKCISGITANPARCRENVEKSIGIVTALNPHIGYETACSVAKEALEKSVGVVEIVRRRKLLDDALLDDILKLENMVQPRRLSLNPDK